MSTKKSSSRQPTPDLAAYSVSRYASGAGLPKRALWYGINALVFMSPFFPVYGLKRSLLRLFGAQVGSGVVIKPRVNIKYPWRLRIDDHSWIGEGSWIENLVEVRIGSNVCISQQAYIMTGNHDYTRTGFDLMTKPIRVEDGAWVGAGAIVCPGITLARNSILSAGSVLTSNTEENAIYAGNPASFKRHRNITA